MNKKEKPARFPFGYLVSEEGHEQLQHLRDEWLLMAHFVLVVTVEEDDMPLEIKRSMLSPLFESYAARLDQIVRAMQWASKSLPMT